MLGKVEISGESIFLWPCHSSKRIYSILFRSRISSLTRVKYLSLTCANLNESDSQYNKGYVPRERIRRWSSAQWSKCWPFFTDINVPLIFTFFDKVQLDLRKFLKKLGYNFSKRNDQIYVSVTLNSDRLTRCRFLIIHVLVDALWYVGHIDFFMKKKWKKTQTLLPSIFITGVHPPSPHPKSPMWQRTETGFSFMIRVVKLLTLSL